LKAPQFEDVAPWADRFGRLAYFCCYLGCANNLAVWISNYRPDPPLYWILAFWWAPVAVVNLIVQHIMVRWSILRLREIRKRLDELWAKVERERR
jgi:hypothetical protein